MNRNTSRKTFVVWDEDEDSVNGATILYHDGATLYIKRRPAQTEADFVSDVLVTYEPEEDTICETGDGPPISVSEDEEFF